MDYEYKCVGAPERPRRSRRARTGSDRLAVAMEKVIAAEAVNGWEYLRTDLVPVIEKTSMLGRAHEVHRAVLVFRRDLEVRRTKTSGRTRLRDDSDTYEEPPRRRGPRRRDAEEVHETHEETPRRRAARRNEPEPAQDPGDDLTPEPAPRRVRAIPAEEPIRLSVEDRIPRSGRDRSPPGLG